MGKVMSLLFNMLSSLVIAFLPRSKRLLISWLQSPSAVILESKKIKSLTVSIVYPSICHEEMDSVGDDNVASDSQLGTTCLFQASGSLLYFDKSIRSEV